jgi:hypothetical protein
LTERISKNYHPVTCCNPEELECPAILTLFAEQILIRRCRCALWSKSILRLYSSLQVNRILFLMIPFLLKTTLNFFSEPTTFRLYSTFQKVWTKSNLSCSAFKLFLFPYF